MVSIGRKTRWGSAGPRSDAAGGMGHGLEAKLKMRGVHEIPERYVDPRRGHCALGGLGIVVPPI